jgi:hypothetical protein
VRRYQVRGAEELRHELRAGPEIELVGRAHLLDAAVVHDRDPVGEHERLLLVVRHVEHRDAELLVDLLDLELELLAQALVEGAERLVHEDQLRLVDEAAGDRDTLLLPARQLLGLAAGVGAQRYRLEHRHDAALDLAAGELAHAQREGDVLEDGHVRHQRVVLKHHAEAALARRHGGHVLAVDEDAAGRRRHHAGDDVEERRLSRAARPQQRHELAGGDRKLEPAERDDAAVRLADILERDRRHPSLRPLPRRATALVYCTSLQ